MNVSALSVVNRIAEVWRKTETRKESGNSISNIHVKFRSNDVELSLCCSNSVKDETLSFLFGNGWTIVEVQGPRPNPYSDDRTSITVFYKG